MPNNPHLHYRPEVFLSTQVTVELPAGDWLTFMAWMMAQNSHDGASYIVYQISDQVTKAIYTNDSLKAAEAQFEEQQEQQNPLTQVFRHLGVVPTITPGQFNGDDNE